jgi:hypothetical protein
MKTRSHPAPSRATLRLALLAALAAGAIFGRGQAATRTSPPSAAASASGATLPS